MTSRDWPSLDTAIMKPLRIVLLFSFCVAACVSAEYRRAADAIEKLRSLVMQQAEKAKKAPDQVRKAYDETKVATDALIKLLIDSLERNAEPQKGDFDKSTREAKAAAEKFYNLLNPNEAVKGEGHAVALIFVEIGKLIEALREYDRQDLISKLKNQYLPVWADYIQ